MTQPTHLREEYYAVEVPTMAFGLMINNYGDESELMYMLSMEDISDGTDNEETLITKKLPKGSWQIICTTKDCTEEQAKTIVETIHVEYAPSAHNDFAGGYDIKWVDYENPGEFAGWHGDAGYQFNAFDSLKSLLKSKNLNGANYIILKKE